MSTVCIQCFTSLTIRKKINDALGTKSVENITIDKEQQAKKDRTPPPREIKLGVNIMMRATPSLQSGIVHPSMIFFILH